MINMSSVDQIINGEIDLYEYIDANPTDSPAVIKRQYRKTALKYHPDKNKDPEAINKFQVLSTIYDILSNESTRHDYDRIRAYKQEKTVRTQELDEQTRRFKEELVRAETRAKSTNNATAVFNAVTKEYEDETAKQNRLEKIRTQNFKRRRTQEQETLGKTSYVSYRDIPVDGDIQLTDAISSSATQNKVIVKWKHRPELGDSFNTDVLAEIMSVFGPVFSIKEVRNTEDKYRAALVEFQTPENADRAVSHDYRKSASVWDGTSYRKLASLLRDCKLYDSNFDHSQVNGVDLREYRDIQDQIMTDNDVVNQKLAALIQR